MTMQLRSPVNDTEDTSTGSPSCQGRHHSQDDLTRSVSVSLCVWMFLCVQESQQRIWELADDWRHPDNSNLPSLTIISPLSSIPPPPLLPVFIISGS